MRLTQYRFRHLTSYQAKGEGTMYRVALDGRGRWCLWDHRSVLAAGGTDREKMEGYARSTFEAWGWSVELGEVGEGL